MEVLAAVVVATLAAMAGLSPQHLYMVSVGIGEHGRYRPARRIVRCCWCATCPAGIISTAAYDVNVPFMQLEQHGWDIHAV